MLSPSSRRLEGERLVHRLHFPDPVARDQLAWKHVELIRRKWKGKLVVKGLVSPADARIARESGVDIGRLSPDDVLRRRPAASGDSGSWRPVGRPSTQVLEQVDQHLQRFGLDVDDPATDGIYKIGVLANVLQSEAWNDPVMKQVPAHEQSTTVCALPLYHIYAFTVGMMLSPTSTCSHVVSMRALQSAGMPPRSSLGSSGLPRSTSSGVMRVGSP